MSIYEACTASSETSRDGVTTPYNNNLDGQGPQSSDPSEIRYRHVAVYEGGHLDLVVSVVAGTAYTPHDVSLNGCSGKFGRFNIKVGSSVDLKFELQDSETLLPIAPKSFYFSLFDLDGYYATSSTPRRYQERVSVSEDEFSAYELAPGSDVHTSSLQGTRRFEATIAAASMPEDPDQLADSQLRVSVKFTFVQTSSFRMQFASGDGVMIEGLRYFYFAGSTNMGDLCPPPPALPPLPPHPPPSPPPPLPSPPPPPPSLPPALSCDDSITTGIAPWRFTSSTWDKSGDNGDSAVYCKPEPNANGWYQESTGCWVGICDSNPHSVLRTRSPNARIAASNDAGCAPLAAVWQQPTCWRWDVGADV